MTTKVTLLETSINILQLYSMDCYADKKKKLNNRKGMVKYKVEKII